MEPIGRGRYGGTYTVYLSTWYVYLEVSDDYYHLVLYLYVFILKYSSQIVINLYYDYSLQYSYVQ